MISNPRRARIAPTFETLEPRSLLSLDVISQVASDDAIMIHSGPDSSDRILVPVESDAAAQGQTGSTPVGTKAGQTPSQASGLREASVSKGAGVTTFPSHANLAHAPVPGLWITASSPSGKVIGPVGRVRVTFDEPIDAHSLTTADVRLTGPKGPIRLTGITPVAGSNRQFDIRFASQSTRGAYTMVIGPSIQDRLSPANLMNQDHDRTPGGQPDDKYTATFQITSTLTFPSVEVPKRIPWYGSAVSTLSIGQDITISDLNVRLNITHPWDIDLSIHLVSPGGIDIPFYRGVSHYPNGYGANFQDTTFDDQATVPIGAGSPPFAGSYKPDSSLARLNGSSARGTWQLRLENVPYSGFDYNGGILNSWSLTINGSQPSPPPSLSINDVSMTEGNSGTKNATFTVSLSTASAQTVTVNYATANGTAVAGSDYTATSGTLTFAPGVTSQTIAVPIIGDTVFEPNETFLVNLSSPLNATLSRSQGTGTILNDDPAASANFAGSDGVTQGNWKGVYGADGYAIPADPSANNPTLPSYVSSLTVSGAVAWPWTTSSTDPRALQQAATGSTSRTAAGWFSSNSFSIDVHMADAASHRLVLYALDYDSGGRAETVSLVDDVTGQVLDSRNLMNFQNGVYLAWDVKGSVTVRVTRTAGANALVSGLFFGGSLPAPATASYAGSDGVTEGNWKGVYGADGYDIPADPSANNPSLPSYVSSLTVSGAVAWPWTTSSTDPRALQQAATGSTSRTAAGWFSSNSFSIDVHMADAASHRLVLYALDYDSGGRAEAVSLVDDVTGQVLDTRSLSSFQNGVYLAWDVKGSVTVKVTRTAGANALVSGLFFG